MSETYTVLDHLIPNTISPNLIEDYVYVVISGYWTNKHKTLTSTDTNSPDHDFIKTTPFPRALKSDHGVIYYFGAQR